MTWTDPVDATANVTAVAAAREKTYVLDNLRAIAEWTSYTPTLTQSSAVTKTVTYAKYKSYGGTVIAQVYLSITGTGTAANEVTVSLPVTAAVSTQITVGNAEYFDTSTNGRYQCGAVLGSTTVVKFIRGDISNALGGPVGVDPNVAIASGDTLSFTIQYEAA